MKSCQIICQCSKGNRLYVMCTYVIVNPYILAKWLTSLALGYKRGDIAIIIYCSMYHTQKHHDLRWPRYLQTPPNDRPTSSKNYTLFKNNSFAIIDHIQWLWTESESHHPDVFSYFPTTLKQNRKFGPYCGPITWWLNEELHVFAWFLILLKHINFSLKTSTAVKL